MGLVDGPLPTLDGSGFALAKSRNQTFIGNAAFDRETGRVILQAEFINNRGITLLQSFQTGPQQTFKKAL